MFLPPWSARAHSTGGHPRQIRVLWAMTVNRNGKGKYLYYRSHPTVWNSDYLGWIKLSTVIKLSEHYSRPFFGLQTHLHRDAGQFHVQLHSSQALLCARYFEVHVTERVLHASNVCVCMSRSVKNVCKRRSAKNVSVSSVSNFQVRPSSVPAILKSMSLRESSTPAMSVCACKPLV